MVEVKDVKKVALMNVYQLMAIGINNSDERIKDVFGSEEGLISIIERYWQIYMDARIVEGKEHE